MKKFALLFLLLATLHNAFAQEPEKEPEVIKDSEYNLKGFDKSKLYTGGSVDMSFFSGTTLLGATPHFGISLNDYVDVAATVGYKYMSQRDFYSNNKIRSKLVTPGAFVRLFPVKFLFAQAQYQYNFVTVKELTPGYPTVKYTDNGSSFLVGGGFANGRDEGQNTYYYMTIMWDLAKSGFSPYKDNQGKAIPIINAGFNIGLFQGRYRR